jgi:Zn-dependent peptidase ImmA (M78 family)
MNLTMEQSTSLIVQRARELVSQLVEHRGNDRPPFLSGEYATLLGIKRIEKADLGDVSAILIKLSDGDVIRVNQSHGLARQNFSCAHEIGHILLRELNLEPQIDDVEFRALNSQAHAMARARARERLCDAAAAELLMPDVAFKKSLSDFRISIKSLEWLANIFRVSISSTAIRIAELSTEPCIALMWHPKRSRRRQPVNKPSALQLAWRVGAGQKPKGKTDHIPVHTLIKNTSTLYKAYESDTPVDCRKDFRLDTGIRRILVQSKGFGQGDARYVISLAFPNR